MPNVTPFFVKITMQGEPCSAVSHDWQGIMRVLCDMKGGKDQCYNCCELLEK